MYFLYFLFAVTFSIHQNLSTNLKVAYQRLQNSFTMNHFERHCSYESISDSSCLLLSPCHNVPHEGQTYVISGNMLNYKALTINVIWSLLPSEYDKPSVYVMKYIFICYAKCFTR